ncbi:MAG: LysR family transcriptional regulator [Pseudomonadota bacterium]
MKTSKLSLKWLEAFLLTARTGAVQDAAEEAGLSVSTVSHHLRSLEDTLGVTLFDHSRRPMRLTSTGALFYSHVDRAVRILRKAEVEAQSGDLADTRAMSLAMVEDFDSEIGPELARALAAGMPKCQFRHLTRPSHDILEMVREQEIDIGIAARPQYISDDVHEIPLMREPFVLVLPANSVEAPESFLEQSAPLPLLRYSSNQIIATQIDQHLRRLRLHIPSRFEFESNQSLMSMVADGDGWTISTPLNFMRARRFHKQIQLAPFPGKSFSRYLSIFTAEATPGQVVAPVSSTMRRLIDERAIRPAVERMPWLAEAFQLLPEGGEG